MATPDIGAFLDELESRARWELLAHRLSCYVGRPLCGAALGLAVAFGLGSMLPLSELGVGAHWLILCGMPVLGLGIGSFNGLATGANLEHELRWWRKQVRDDLAGSSLLQLAFEHEPYERMPSLRPRLVKLPLQLRQDNSAGLMADRLERLIDSYRGCCADVGLRTHISWGSFWLVPIAVRLELAELLKAEKRDEPDNH